MFTLHNGDCLEYMKSMPDKSVDVIITDPPYNERTHQGAVTGQTFGVRKNEIDFAPLLDPEHLVREFLRISKHWCLAFCSVEDFYLYKEEAYKQKAWVRAAIWDRVAPPRNLRVIVRLRLLMESQYFILMLISTGMAAANREFGDTQWSLVRSNILHRSHWH